MCLHHPERSESPHYSARLQKFIITAGEPESEWTSWQVPGWAVEMYAKPTPEFIAAMRAPWPKGERW